MGRQVQQHTFDSIVRESVEEFGMSWEEAVQDTIEQLKKTGVNDFSNISTVPRGDEASVVSQLDNNNKQVIELIETIRTSITANDLTGLSHSVSNLLVASPQSRSALPIDIFSATLSFAEDKLPGISANICKLIFYICDKDDANRSRLSTNSELNLYKPLKKLLATCAKHLDYSKRSGDELKLVESTLSAIGALQHRNEWMKRKMASDESPRHLLTLFRQVGACDLQQSKPHCSLFCATCKVLSQWLTHEDKDIDPRMEVAEAFSRARVVAGEQVVTESGLRSLPLTEVNLITSATALLEEKCRSLGEDEDEQMRGRRRICVKECLVIIRALAQSDEICKGLVDEGIIQNTLKCLKHYSTDEAMVAICTQMLGKLSLRDACKSTIFSDGMAVVTQLTKPFFSTSERVITAYFWLVARLTLRRPDIAREVARSGVTDAVVRIMKDRMGTVKVVTAGCHVLRNVCSRDESARRRVREGHRHGEGVAAEAVVREVVDRWGNKTDIAYYTLQTMDALKDDEMRWDQRYGNRPTGSTTIVTGASKIQ